MAEGSKIFTPYRALGLVSTDVAPVVRYIQRRKENLIVTVVGNTFHTYGEAKLSLLSVGNPHQLPIVAVCGDAFHIYTASGNDIFAWRRGTELKHKYVGHEASVHLMLPFGPHLIAIDRLNCLRVWDIKAESLYMLMEFQAKSFEISAIIHPATYLNKILLGSKQGKMQLWNLKTCKLVYSFKGWEGAGVCVLEQAPAPDVAAVGLTNGKIILHNIKFDETVMEFHQDWGKVTGIGFRTDGFPVMVSGSEIGHIAIWNLQEKNLVSQLRYAHHGPVLGVKCLLNEPLLITSSPDNTLKMWIFDLPDGGARLLKIRDGHSSPPLCTRFHGSRGDIIISAGEDSSMRIFSTATDIVNKSLGRASYNRKISKKRSMNLDRKVMPAITRFTSETAQEKAWDNLAAVHRGKAVVTTWSIDAQRMGDHKLLHERFKTKEYSNSVATCLDLTVCGNFVIIGYSSGHIDKYNIQSGFFRGTYGDPAHEGGVCGLVTDGLNQYVISGGENGHLKWWRMKNCQIIKGLNLNESISKMLLHKDSGLLGIALEDWSIYLVDVDTKKVVRKLYGHQNQVTDLAFSPDSKWLISSSLDKTVKTWDIPSGVCVDCFLVPIPCISLTMSPVGDFLATAHTDHLGIYLWSNQACYHHLSLRPLPKNFKATTVFLPSTCADSSQLAVKEGEEIVEDIEVSRVEDDDEYKSPEQISEEFVTLALLPTSRWLNLLSLDVIKKRNKPVEPPKVPKSAPFFLPTVPGLEFKFAQVEEKKDEIESKVKSVMSFEVLTEFGKKLKVGELEAALSMLMSQGPSGVEVEIRGLDPDVGGSEEVMIKFLEMIKFALEKQCNFEAVQGYLGLYLKLHADYIVTNEDVYQMCDTVAGLLGKSWHNLRDSMNQTLCLVSYFKNAALINY